MHEIPELDRKGLREFGLVTGAILMALFGLFFPWLLGRAVPLWPWLVGTVLFAWSFAAPMSLNPLYRQWMKLGLLMSRITTPVILGVVFFLVLTPMGLVMRAMGRDPMARKLDQGCDSYRVASKARPREHVERPF